MYNLISKELIFPSLREMIVFSMIFLDNNILTILEEIKSIRKGMNSQKIITTSTIKSKINPTKYKKKNKRSKLLKFHGVHLCLKSVKNLHYCAARLLMPFKLITDQWRFLSAVSDNSCPRATCRWTRTIADITLPWFEWGW